MNDISEELQRRLANPIIPKGIGDPTIKPMLILNSDSNPNIVLVVKEESVKEETPVEQPTVGHIDDRLSESVIKNVLEQSDKIREFLYEVYIPLELGFEDASEKINEEISIIFEGQGAVKLDNVRRVLNRTLTASLFDYFGSELNLDKRRVKLILEGFINEQIERFRTVRRTNNE